MAKFSLTGSSVGSFVNILKEVDVRHIRAAADVPFSLAVLSRDLPLAKHVVHLLNKGPRDYDVPAALAVMPLALDEAGRAVSANLVVIVARASDANDDEIGAVHALEKHDIPTVVCLLDDLPPAVEQLQRWYPAKPVHVQTFNGEVNDVTIVERIVASALTLKELDPIQIARHVPAFRRAVSLKLIEDTSNTNAAYAFGTALIEINPLTSIPVGVADVVILTKNQGIMAYKIALAMGMPSDVQHIMPQIAAVVGGGFVFRTIARTAVSFVPVIGILPKTAIAYGGTRAIGEAVYKWAESGERMSVEAAQGVYHAALERGKVVANRLQSRRRRAPAAVTPAAVTLDAATPDEPQATAELPAPPSQPQAAGAPVA